VPVLQAIGVIGQVGESTSEFNPGGVSTAREDKVETPTQKPAIEEEEFDETLETTAIKDIFDNDAFKISPRAKNLAAKHKIPTKGIYGSGPYGRIIEDDIKKALQKRPKVTPLARAIAEQEHLEIPSKGSGYGGKILASDVKIVPSVALANDYEDVKLSNIRKIIGKNMYESLANTAQLTLHSSADARKLLEYRKIFKSKTEKGYAYNITINDMVSLAAIKALSKHQGLNAHFQGDTMRYFKNVHLGFAVDTPRGLMVPTLKNANHLSMEGLSQQIKDLASACQGGSINPEHLQGATFTLTNLGSFGIEMFTPVLNPPQVGILGINTITYQPADIGGGIFGFVPRIGLSLTFDHRAVDGAPAAAFLKEVSKEIEKLLLDI
jgi:pyruvate dehydrogenase E2 component (dihydrolipoamide acetyltransferase)